MQGDYRTNGVLLFTHRLDEVGRAHDCGLLGAHGRPRIDVEGRVLGKRVSAVDPSICHGVLFQDNAGLDALGGVLGGSLSSRAQAQQPESRLAEERKTPCSFCRHQTFRIPPRS